MLKCSLTRNSCEFATISPKGENKGKILCEIATHWIKEGRKRIKNVTSEMKKCPFTHQES